LEQKASKTGNALGAGAVERPEPKEKLLIEEMKKTFEELLKEGGKPTPTPEETAKKDARLKELYKKFQEIVDQLKALEEGKQN